MLGTLRRTSLGLCAAVARLAARPLFWRGAAAGSCLLVAAFDFVATFGAGPRVATAAVLVTAAAAEFALRGRGPVRGPRALLLLSAWAVAMPWLCDWLLASAAFLPEGLLASAPGGWLFASLSALLLAPPAYWGTRLAVTAPRGAATSDRPAPGADSAPSAATLTGIAAGLAATAALVAPLVGLQSVAWGVTCIAVVWMWRTARAPGYESQDRPLVGLPAGAPPTPQSGASESIAALAGAAACGASFVLLDRMTAQLMPASVFVGAAQWAGLLAGLAWGLRRAALRGAVRPSSGASACLLGAAWLVAVMAAFPLLVRGALLLNAHVASVLLLVAGRSLLAGGVMLPIGYAWGRSAAARRSAGPPAPPAAFAAGLCGVGTFGFAAAGLPALVVGTAWCGLGTALFRRLPARSLPVSRRRWGVVAAAVTVVCAAPLLRGQYDPAQATRLLFSTNVMLARQAGLDLRTLQVLDEGRCVAHLEGGAGARTVWVHRGCQYQIRGNGIITGVASARPSVCPQYAPEVLLALMPLTLHERPHRVLVLGAGGGVPLTTSLAFAVQELTCAEPDAALLRALREHVWPAGGSDPLADPRVRLLPLDAPLAVAARGEPADVIISNPDHPALAAAAPCYTREFYRRAARRLADGGIFCQRLQFIDLGPEPLRTIAATLRTAFREVTLLEAAPGEMLLLGTNSPAGLARPGFAERLQLPQTRRQLAQVGWDWSVPLNLAAWDTAAVDDVARVETFWKRALCRLRLADEPLVAVRPNTVANGTFGFALPREVMRWAPKQQQVAKLLRPRTGRFAEWGDVDPADPDLLQRLAEVTGQAKLMCSNPDQPWAYRQAAREQVRNTTRSKIIQVRGETSRHDVHPEDRHRLGYFSALGHALRQRPVDLEDVRRVERFEQPYDPMISYFLHQEVADLYKHAEPRDVRAELAHRLHAAYYGHASDRSVRNVVEAIHLVAGHPEACDSPAERRDQLDALLQALKQRWEARSGVASATPQVLLIDIEKTLTAMDAASAALDRLDADLGPDGTDWPARRAFLEKTLARPLRSYRTDVLAQRRRERAQQASADQAEPEPTNDDSLKPLHPLLLPDELN